MDMSKEKKEQEKVQDNLLLEYQQRRDLLALANEQAARMKTIGFNREMASVNLEAAQRTKVSRFTNIMNTLFVQIFVCGRQLKIPIFLM